METGGGAVGVGLDGVGADAASMIAEQTRQHRSQRVRIFRLG